VFLSRQESDKAFLLTPHVLHTWTESTMFSATPSVKDSSVRRIQIPTLYHAFHLKPRLHEHHLSICSSYRHARIMAVISRFFNAMSRRTDTGTWFFHADAIAAICLSTSHIYSLGLAVLSSFNTASESCNLVNACNNTRSCLR
jgi:hypothetical protein